MAISAEELTALTSGLESAISNKSKFDAKLKTSQKIAALIDNEQFLQFLAKKRKDQDVDLFQPEDSFTAKKEKATDYFKNAENVDSGFIEVDKLYQKFIKSHERPFFLNDILQNMFGFLGSIMQEGGLADTLIKQFDRLQKGHKPAGADLSVEEVMKSEDAQTYYTYVSSLRKNKELFNNIVRETLKEYDDKCQEAKNDRNLDSDGKVQKQERLKKVLEDKLERTLARLGQALIQDGAEDKGVELLTKVAEKQREKLESKAREGVTYEGGKALLSEIDQHAGGDNVTFADEDAAINFGGPAPLPAAPTAPTAPTSLAIAIVRNEADVHNENDAVRKAVHNELGDIGIDEEITPEKKTDAVHIATLAAVKKYAMQHHTDGVSKEKLKQVAKKAKSQALRDIGLIEFARKYIPDAVGTSRSDKRKDLYHAFEPAFNAMGCAFDKSLEIDEKINKDPILGKGYNRKKQSALLDRWAELQVQFDELEDPSADNALDSLEEKAKSIVHLANTFTSEAASEFEVEQEKQKGQVKNEFENIVTVMSNKIDEVKSELEAANKLANSYSSTSWQRGRGQPTVAEIETGAQRGYAKRGLNSEQLAARESAVAKETLLIGMKKSLLDYKKKVHDGNNGFAGEASNNDYLGPKTERALEKARNELESFNRVFENRPSIAARQKAEMGGA